jgi:hypothetical protein
MPTPSPDPAQWLAELSASQRSWQQLFHKSTDSESSVNHLPWYWNDSLHPTLHMRWSLRSIRLRKHKPVKMPP